MLENYFAAASAQASDLVPSIEALWLSRLFQVPDIKVKLDFIFGMEINLDLITTNEMPWSGHFPLKA